MHGEVHQPNRAVIHESIPVLAVQVGLAADRENDTCKQALKSSIGDGEQMAVLLSRAEQGKNCSAEAYQYTPLTTYQADNLSCTHGL